MRDFKRFIQALVIFGATVGGPSIAIADIDREAPKVVHEPCVAYQPGRAVTIRARFFDESRIYDPRIHYRSDSSSGWLSIGFSEVSGGGHFEVVLESDALRGPFEYFVEVFDEYGNGPARLGTPDAAIVVRPDTRSVECAGLPPDSGVAGARLFGISDDGDGVSRQEPGPRKELASATSAETEILLTPPAATLVRFRPSYLIPFYGQFAQDRPLAGTVYTLVEVGLVAWHAYATSVHMEELSSKVRSPYEPQMRLARNLSGTLAISAGVAAMAESLIVGWLESPRGNGN